MTTSPLPAAELRAAAAKLRALLADPEMPTEAFLVHTRDPEAVCSADGAIFATAQTPAIAQWIAAMDPGAGRALADWLDSAATEADEIGPDPEALAVARAINGGSQP